MKYSICNIHLLPKVADLRKEAFDEFPLNMAIVLQLLSKYFPGMHWSHSSSLLVPKVSLPNCMLGLCTCVLSPPLQFGPLTYQPIEWGFISSNQSALWSCLLHVTFQLGEGCSMSFVRFVFLILWKTCVWNSFRAFSPMGFWRILKSPRSTHMFICWRARKLGTRMKAQASCPNKKFEEGQ